jgi:hypothetical protein
MRSFVNRFLAYLFLLLLPLQSQAAVAVLTCYAEMRQATVVEHVMEDCHDDAIIQDSMSDAGTPDTEQHAGSPHSSPCGMSSSCLVLAANAVLPDTQVLLIEPAILLVEMTNEFYLSFIPYALQRPPKLTLS